MNNNDPALIAVWLTVRRGDRSGTAVSPGVVYARTGTWLDTATCNTAVDTAVQNGHLYWRGSKIHRRLLPGPDPRPAPPTPSSDQDALF